MESHEMCWEMYGGVDRGREAHGESLEGTDRGKSGTEFLWEGQGKGNKRNAERGREWHRKAMRGRVGLMDRKKQGEASRGCEGWKY